MMRTWCVCKDSEYDEAWLHYVGIPLFPLYPNEYKIHDKNEGFGHLVAGGRFRLMYGNSLQITEWPHKLEYDIWNREFARRCLLDIINNCKDGWNFNDTTNPLLFLRGTPIKDPVGKFILRFKNRDDAFRLKLMLN